MSPLDIPQLTRTAPPFYLIGLVNCSLLVSLSRRRGSWTGRGPGVSVSQLGIPLAPSSYFHASIRCFSSSSWPSRIDYAQSCDVYSVIFLEN